MALIRSLLFLIVFYVLGAFVIGAAVVASWFGEAGVIRYANRWARWHRFCARWLLGIEARIEGALDTGQALYVFKHESMFEAVQTLAWFERPIVVMKRELLAIPGWGYAAKQHGSIFVDREAGPAAMRTLIAAARTARESGRPIVIFPEGTRMPHGVRAPLKSGLAGLYKILGLPVVPVAVDSGRVWPKGFVKRPGIVHLKVGETIPAGLPREDFEARVLDAINALND